MSRAKSSLLFAALSVIATTAACATAPSAEEAANAEYQKAMEAALKPATADEIAAANRSDPLTKANFWNREYSKNPENLDIALTFARSLRDIGSDQRVIEILSQLLVTHPDNPELCMMLGRAFMRTGAPRPAVTAFLRAAEIEPKRAEAWGALGTALDKLDQHAQAQEAYSRALAINPKRTVTLTNYGLSLALSGDLKGAEDKLRLAAIQPDAAAQVQENLALVLGLQGRYEEMKTVSGALAPSGVADANAAALKAMIEPSRTWEKMKAAADAPAPIVQTAAIAPAQSAPVAGSLRLQRAEN